MRTELAQPIRLQDYSAPDWKIEQVDLDISLDPTKTRVKARLTISPAAGAAAPAQLKLDGDSLNFVGLTIDGQAAGSGIRTTVTPDALTILQPPQQRFVLEIETLVDPVVQHQADGALPLERHLLHAMRGRRLSPHHLFPRPSRCDGGLHDADRGRPQGGAASSRQRQSDRIRRHCRHRRAISRSGTIRFRSRPICSQWSAATSAASTTVSSRMSGRKVALKIFVEHGKEARAAYAMDSLKRSMRWDEEAFGREYDLDIFMIVAVSDFNMGAMENKGLNVFNDKYVLASPETATDADYAGIETVIAHEYFHNWTGNRITCRDWFQLCLKEGLTVFRDQEFSSDQRSRPVKRIADVRQLRAVQFMEDAGPLAHPVRPGDLSRDQQFLHADGLRKRRRSHPHAQDPDRRRRISARAWTFISSATTARRPPSSSSCTASPTRPARPRPVHAVVSAGRHAGRARDRDAMTMRRSTLTLDIAQSLAPTPGQPTKQPMVIPLALGLVDAAARICRSTGRRPASFRATVIVLTKPSERFVFTGVAQKPVVSLNRGFSAPIKLTVVNSLARRPARSCRHATAIRSTAGRRCKQSRRHI